MSGPAQRRPVLPYRARGRTRDARTGILFVSWLALQALAPRAAQAAVELRPSQITVEAEVGAVIRRGIQLRTPEDIGPLQAQPLELLAARGGRVIPLDHIKVTPPSLPADAGAQTRALLLEIDLRDVAAGEYSGELPFTYGRAEIKLPLKIAVRHRWPLPLVVLLLGIGSGLGLSAYRARGRPRDQVLVRIGLLRGFLQRDHELAQGIALAPAAEAGLSPTGAAEPGAAPADPPRLRNPFLISLTAVLQELELSLSSERWDDLTAKLDQAEALLRKWIQHRQGFSEQLAYLGRLLQQRPLRDGGDSRYLATLRAQVTELIAAAPQKDSPGALRAAASELAEHLAQYESAEAKLAVLDELRTRLPRSEEPPWLRRSSELRTRLEGARPSEQALTALAAEIDAAVAELTAQLSAVSSRSIDAPAGVLRAAAAESSAALAHGWPIQPGAPTSAESAAGAQSRLRWFSYSGYAIALLLLAGAGFNEVYAKKPAFGAEPWADYLALLLWGFGAEATRDAVASTLRGWGVAVDGKPGDGR